MKTKEYIKKLKEYASEMQMNADEMAITIIDQEEIFGAISVVQSICKFNLAWLYQLAPDVGIHKKTILFLAENVSKFKRQLSVDEMFKIDGIFTANEIADFNELKNKFKQ